MGILLRKMPEKPGSHDDRRYESQNKRKRLRFLKAGQAANGRQDQNGGDKEPSTAQRRKHRGSDFVACALKEHFRDHGSRRKEQGDTLQTQGACADFDYGRIIAEQLNQVVGNQKHDDGSPRYDHLCQHTGKTEGVFDPVIAPGAVVESADWLKSLTDSDPYGENQEDNAVDNAQRGDRFVTIDGCLAVQQDSGQTGQSLTEKTGKPGGTDVADKNGSKRDLPDGQLYLCAPGQEHEKLDHKADELAESGCQAGPADPHFEHKDKQRIQYDVQNTAGHHTGHPQSGLSLKPQNVIQDKTGHGKRAGQKDIGDIGSGIRGDGGRTAERHDQAAAEQQAEYGKYHTDGQGKKEGGGGGSGRLFVIPCAQEPGYDTAASLTEHEPDSLNDRHKTEDNANGSAGAGADHTDKSCICQVVDAGDQHAKNRWNGQTGDQLVDRGGGHAFKLRNGSSVHVRFPVRLGLVSEECSVYQRAVH